MLNGQPIARWLCVAALLLAISSTSAAQLPVTQLRSLYPPVAQVGSTTTVDITGGGPLEEVDRLIFSHPGLSANVVAGQSHPITGETQRSFGKFNVSVASDLPPGFYEAWAVGRHGVSFPRVFWVTAQPIGAAPQSGNEAGPFPNVALDTVIVDRYVPARVQRYDLQLMEGQRVRVSVFDARLDSRALSNLRVLSPSGQLITSARSEGAPGALAVVEAKQAGTYRLELRDAVYRGGDEFTYALLVESSAAPAAEPLQAEWATREQLLAAFRPTQGQLTPTQRLSALQLARNLANDSHYYYLPEPRAEPLEVSLPMVACGTSSASIAGEAFQFNAKKGEVYQFEVASDCLGESSDCKLSLYKVTPAEGGPKLDRLVEQDDASASGTPPFRVTRRDPSLRWEVPEDATYRAVVRDQLATSDATAGKRYLLIARQPQPAIDLLAAWAFPTNTPAQSRPIGNNLLVGGSVAIRVLAMRTDGAAGPIEVSCEGLPEGVVAPPVIIPADRDEGHLIITCAAQTNTVVVPVKIIGKLQSDTQPLTTQAVAAALTWESMPSWNTILNRTSQQLMLAVNEFDAVPVTFAVDQAQPLVMARGGKLPIPIAVTRRPGGADKAVLRVQGLPPKTTLGDVTIEGNATQASPEVVIAADAPIGQWSLWFQAETKVKFRNNPQALSRAEATKATLEKIQADPARAAEKDAIDAALKAVTDTINQLKDQTGEKDVAVFLPTNSFGVKIVDAPLEPAAMWRIESKRAAQSDHTLTIKRLFGLDSAVDVKLEPAVAGVELTVPAFPAGADQTQAHLNLAADAPVGTRTLTLKLTYKFNNQDLSALVPLELVVTE